MYSLDYLEMALHKTENVIEHDLRLEISYADVSLNSNIIDLLTLTLLRRYQTTQPVVTSNQQALTKISALMRHN